MVKLSISMNEIKKKPKFIFATVNENVQ